MRTSVLQRQAAAALDVLRHVSDAVSTGQAADHSLAALMTSRREYGSRDRRLFGQVVFSHFRWRGWVESIPGEEARAAAAFYLDALERHPTVDLWAPPAFAPAGTLDLDGKAAALARWLDLPQPPDWRRLVPDWTEAELLDDGQPDLLRRFVLAAQVRPPVWLRCRRGRTAAVQDALRELNIASRTHPRLPEAIAVEGTIPVADLQKRTQGAFEVQDLASQVAGLCCAPKPGQHWWDVCAGSGGKSLHLADLLALRGSLLATDVREAALRELAQRARAARIAGLNIERPDRSGQVPVPPPASLDGILVDAPCSGLGTWSRAPDARWRVRQAQLPEFASRQLAILRRAAPALRPGGVLVYAVCSLTRTETTGVAEQFLAAEPAFHALPIPNPLDPAGAPKDHVVVPPDAGPGIGMFIASFKRVQ